MRLTFGSNVGPMPNMFSYLFTINLLAPILGVQFINHHEWHGEPIRRQAPKPIPLPVISDSQVEEMLFGGLDERPVEARAAATYRGEPPGQRPQGDYGQPEEPYQGGRPGHQPEYFPPEVPVGINQ